MKKNLGKKIWSLYQKLNSSVVGRCLSLFLELVLSVIGAYLCYKYAEWLLDHFVELMMASGFMAAFGVIIWIASLVAGVGVLCLPFFYFCHHISCLSKKGTC